VDEARFERAWRKHSSAVLRYCTYSVGSVDAAEDLAAETFARFLAKGERVPEERTEAWLIRVARNLCVSHHRSVQRGRTLLTRMGDTPEPHSDGWADPVEWQCVSQLSERQRLVVFLRVVEERPFAEVARAMGVSESAAKMTFHRAVRRLRRVMPHPGLHREDELERGVERA
jgi:RNA polymerase sigma-70 factor (ECF subfamily)